MSLARTFDMAYKRISKGFASLCDYSVAFNDRSSVGMHFKISYRDSRLFFLSFLNTSFIPSLRNTIDIYSIKLSVWLILKLAIPPGMVISFDARTVDICFVVIISRIFFSAYVIESHAVPPLEVHCFLEKKNRKYFLK